jgi:hypothetical protein
VTKASSRPGRPGASRKSSTVKPAAIRESATSVGLLDRPERQFLDHSTMTSDLVVTEERNE